LRAAGTAILVITHLVFEQDRFDRICHLTSGRIEEGADRHAPAA
jgi:ABC-type transport system involved in cytochrome bd biosynthesis fused ATPase/permease subunit